MRKRCWLVTAMLKLKSKFSRGFHWYSGGILLKVYTFHKASTNTPTSRGWDLSFMWKWKCKLPTWFSVTPCNGVLVNSWWDKNPSSHSAFSNIFLAAISVGLDASLQPDQSESLTFWFGLCWQCWGVRPQIFFLWCLVGVFRLVTFPLFWSFVWRQQAFLWLYFRKRGGCPLLLLHPIWDRWGKSKPKGLLLCHSLEPEVSSLPAFLCLSVLFLFYR